MIGREPFRPSTFPEAARRWSACASNGVVPALQGRGFEPSIRLPAPCLKYLTTDTVSAVDRAGTNERPVIKLSTARITDVILAPTSPAVCRPGGRNAKQSERG